MVRIRFTKRRVLIIAAVLVIAALSSPLWLPAVSPGMRIRVVVRKLQSREAATRAKASDELEEICRQTPGLLIDALRKEARREYRQPGGLRLLIERFFWSSRFHYLEWVITRTFIRVGEPSVDTLAGALSDEEYVVRRWAAYALSYIDCPKADEVWAAAIESPYDEVRLAAIECLARRGDAGMVERLIALLERQDHGTMWAAAKLLDILDDEAAREPLRAFAERNSAEAAAAKYADIIASGRNEDIVKLAFLLERYGDDRMATHFYWSRKTELGYCAERWAKRRGRLETVRDWRYAGQPPTWGVKRPMPPTAPAKTGVAPPTAGAQ